MDRIFHYRCPRFQEGGVMELLKEMGHHGTQLNEDNLSWLFGRLSCCLRKVSHD
jgi:hypothetical protein